jgi:hypothetical protein
MLLSFRLVLKQLQKRLQIALSHSNPEFGSPDAQAGDSIIAFSLRQHTFGSSDVNHRR